MTSQHALSLYLVLLAILVQVMTPHSSDATDLRTPRDRESQGSWEPQTSRTRENKTWTKSENLSYFKSKFRNSKHFSEISKDNISSDNNEYMLPVKHDESGTNEKSVEVEFDPVSFVLPASEDSLHKKVTMRHWNFENESREKKHTTLIKSEVNYDGKNRYVFSGNSPLLSDYSLKISDNVHTVLEHGRVKRYIHWNGSGNENCARFENPERNPAHTLYTLYSPGEPDCNYTRNIKCEIVLTADSGKLLELDFRNSFQLELSENCTYDYLEVRDGAFGYSDELGRYCGSKFPPPIRSTGKHLWLHFNSDDNIEYSGFTAVIKMVDRPTNGTLPPETNDCYEEVEGDEGFVNRSMVPEEFVKFAQDHQTHLDCLWKIVVRPDWKINLNFTKFALQFPNERNKNYVDVFDNDTSIAQKKGNFCGSIAEPVSTLSNILFLHFYADHLAVNSTFEVIYTAFRDLKEPSKCIEGEEFDCEDTTCIAISLKCNGRNNCKHKNDEVDCEGEQTSPLATTHIVVIVVVFALILFGMCFVFVFKCVRKLMSDHKLIDEHIRQSREDRLDEIGVCEAAEVAKQARAESLASLASASANVNNANSRNNNRRNESLDRRRLRHLTSCEDSRGGDDSEQTLHSERMDVEQSQRAERQERTDVERSQRAERQERMDVERSQRAERQERMDVERSQRAERQERMDIAERLDHLDRMDHDVHKDPSNKRDRIAQMNRIDQRSCEAGSRNTDRRDRMTRSDRMNRVDHAVQIGDDDRSSRDRSRDMQDEECQTRESLFEQPPLLPNHSTSFGNSEGSVAAGSGGGFSTFGYGGGGGRKGAGRSESTLRRVESPPAPAPRAYRAEAVVRLEGAAVSTENTKYAEDSRPVSCTTTRSAPDVIIVTKLSGH